MGLPAGRAKAKPMSKDSTIEPSMLKRLSIDWQSRCLAPWPTNRL